LELEVHFESELTLIQWLNEEYYIKSMYIKYITYDFSIAIGFMFVVHETLPNNFFLKNAMSIYKISSSLIW
jgi:hypothetical protein